MNRDVVRRAVPLPRAVLDVAEGISAGSGVPLRYVLALSAYCGLLTFGQSERGERETSGDASSGEVVATGERSEP